MAPSSPGMRATSVELPPPSNCIPVTAPKAIINAANCGCNSPIDNAGRRPSISKSRSAPLLVMATPLAGMCVANSPVDGPSGSEYHAPFLTSSGPPPIAAVRFSSAGVVSPSMATVSPGSGSVTLPYAFGPTAK